MFIFERETECEQGRDKDREGGTEFEAGPRIRAVSAEPDAGPELMNCEIMTWAEAGHIPDWATQVPRNLKIFN